VHGVVELLQGGRNARGIAHRVRADASCSRKLRSRSQGPHESRREQGDDPRSRSHYLWLPRMARGLYPGCKG
jgi:hypothetical protein